MKMQIRDEQFKVIGEYEMPHRDRVTVISCRVAGNGTRKKPGTVVRDVVLK